MKKLLLLIGLVVFLTLSVSADQNSRLLKLLKKDYEQYKTAVFNLAKKNEYSCFYERGKIFSISSTETIKYPKTHYISDTSRGPHHYFYHSDNFEYVVPQTVNPQTNIRTYAPLVLEFSGKYRKYLEGVNMVLKNKKDSFDSKMFLPDKSILSYIFNKKNNELRFIYENGKDLKDQGIKKVDFYFQCNPTTIKVKKEKQSDTTKVVKLEPKKTTTKITEQTVTVESDTTGPEIIIKDTFTTDQNLTAIIKGRVEDDSVIASLIIDGDQVSFTNGNFSQSLYVTEDREVIIAAIDKYGNRSNKIVLLKRGQVQPVAVKFDPLDPRKIKTKINNNAVALIIGVEEYENTFNAMFAKKDAQLFHDFANQVFGVPFYNIKLLTNSGARRNDTLLQIATWLPKIIKENKTDFYLFFSGHGLASSDGKDLFLLPYDGIPQILEASSLLRNYLFQSIAKLNPRSVTVFLDTCYSGTTRSEEMLVAARPIFIEVAEQEIPDNFTVFSASASKETAKVLKEAEHGLFSYFLMKGLEGEADANSDQQITNEELITFINKNVSRQASQTPQLAGDASRILVQW